jgi:hypothetical protein
MKRDSVGGDDTTPEGADMVMRPSDIAASFVVAAFGGLTGWMLGGIVGLLIGVAGGTLFGVVAGRMNVRPTITMTVFVGAMTGALIGASVVETICLPASCVAVESGAAIVLGIGALIGVGLVAALVARSFDEYNESVSAGRKPPEPGCEAEPTEPDEGSTSPVDDQP